MVKLAKTTLGTGPEEGHRAAFWRLQPSDVASPIIGSIVDLVPASAWIFTRKQRDRPTEVYASSAHASMLGLDERARFEHEPPSGIAILPPRMMPQEYASGVTALIGDGPELAALTLLRDGSHRAFTDDEIRLLIVLGHVFAQRYRDVRLASVPLSVAFRPRPAFPISTAAIAMDTTLAYVVDDELNLVMSWNGDRAPLHARLPGLGAEISRAVREALTAWDGDAASNVLVRSVSPWLTLKLLRLLGPGGTSVCIVMEREQYTSALLRAWEQFEVSPRQLQVLAHLLHGEPVARIASELYLTISTIQKHTQALLERTSSRNRSEMTAKILGWKPGSR